MNEASECKIIMQGRKGNKTIIDWKTLLHWKHFTDLIGNILQLLCFNKFSPSDITHACHRQSFECGTRLNTPIFSDIVPAAQTIFIRTSILDFTKSFRAMAFRGPQNKKSKLNKSRKSGLGPWNLSVSLNPSCWNNLFKFLLTAYSKRASVPSS